MELVGLSTKCFSQVSIPLGRQAEICKNAHGNVFEIDFTVNDIRTEMSDTLVEKIRRFNKVFLLAPKRAIPGGELIDYSNNEKARETIARLADVSQEVGSNGVIFYPY